MVQKRSTNQKLAVRPTTILIQALSMLQGLDLSNPIRSNHFPEQSAYHRLHLTFAFSLWLAHYYY